MVGAGLVVFVNEIKELRDVARSGVRLLEKKKGVKQAEVFVSANYLSVFRICFSTNIPNNALEEPKSIEDYGLGVRVFFENGKIGFGKVDSSLSRNDVELAFEKAEKSAVLDNDFVSLPEPMGKPKIKNYHDKKIVNLKDEKAIDLSYSCLYGALDVLKKKKFEKNCNITGELNFLTEKVAIANTNGIDEFDESTIAIGTLTTILELEKDFSGMWFDSSTSLAKFNPYKAGMVSAEKALASTRPKSIDSGTYRVVLSRQAIADLFSHIFSPGLSDVDIGASYFGFNDLGKQCADEKVSIFDDALLPDAIGTKRITDEGIATSKVKIVENGELVNFLSNDYYARKCAKKDKRFVPCNGFRFGGGGRHYDSTPGISATNLVIKEGTFSDKELISEVKNGVYIGRIWYTYPINGSTTADFTSTIRGDSFIIRNGELAEGLTPNTVRINDNLLSLLKDVVGLSKKKEAALVWGAEAAVVCPEIAFGKMRLDRIAEGLY